MNFQNKWMELFPSIIAKARTVQILTPGLSGPSGSLHLVGIRLMFRVHKIPVPIQACKNCIKSNTDSENLLIMFFFLLYYCFFNYSVIIISPDVCRAASSLSIGANSGGLFSSLLPTECRGRNMGNR